MLWGNCHYAKCMRAARPEARILQACRRPILRLSPRVSWVAGIYGPLFRTPAARDRPELAGLSHPYAPSAQQVVNLERYGALEVYIKPKVWPRLVGADVLL